MNFNSKETYLEQVAEWKYDYMKASHENRVARKELNEARRVYSKNMTYENLSAVNKAISKRAGAIAHANRLLDYRQEMKKEAVRQYKERKAAK